MQLISADQWQSSGRERFTYDFIASNNNKQLFVKKFSKRKTLVLIIPDRCSSARDTFEYFLIRSVYLLDGLMQTLLDQDVEVVLDGDLLQFQQILTRV